MRVLFTLWILLGWMACPGEVAASQAKPRIAIISSYSPDYLWSQDTSAGVIAALLELGYLDEAAQGRRFSAEDSVESSRAVIRKWWMDTKHHSTLPEIRSKVVAFMQELDDFAPDILLLGDDNATRYFGEQYIDSETPVVFWGVNGNPLKYALIDSVAHPGHNITGVYQAGYLQEGLDWLTRLLPDVKTIAVLSDDSETGRSKAKGLQQLARKGELPVTLVETVITGSLATWQERALELQDRVDAFFVLNHNTLKDQSGAAVDQLEVGDWYLRHIHKPDVGQEKQFVEEGVLCAIDDSGFKQGYEAVHLMHRILHDGESPADITVYAPSRGAFVVNLERAAMLGLSDVVAASPLVEDRVDTALALERKR
jgi:ABC-type uncharacterized transport system substrate-binding protein